MYRREKRIISLLLPGRIIVFFNTSLLRRPVKIIKILKEMGKKSENSRDITSHGLLLFIYQRRVPLLTVTLAALVVSVVVSLLITPRYSSSVTIYPSPVSGISRSLIGSDLSRVDMMSFGQESDAERLLQLLQSDVIRDRMIERYNLMEHYGINENSRYPYTALNRKYNSNVNFGKTRYMAIDIEVQDTDPAVAASMANDIAAYVDSVMNHMMRDRALRSLAIVEEEYRRLKQDVSVLEDSLRKIREMGIIDYESQAEVLNEAYAAAVLNRDTAGINFFSEKLGMLSSYGGAYINLRDNLVLHLEKLNELRSFVDEARINAEGFMPYKYVVSDAREAEKKSYPVRSVIVAASTVSAFLLTLFALLLTDAFRRQVLVRAKKTG